MNQDIEADFWKDIFVHMQHKNMVRTNAENLSFQNAQKEFERFQKIHPEIHAEIEQSSNYVTWEIFLTDTIKLRLFIQSQIKCTLLQKNNGDLVKIADGKFPYNPFMEIEEFLKNRNSYEIDLKKEIDEHSKFMMLQKITGEFIKALLKEKFDNTNTIWHLEFTKRDYNLVIQTNEDEKRIPISFKNFKSDISKI